MGFVLTLFYLLTSYLSPGLLFGDLAQYHFEMILAILALLASIPSLRGSGIARAPQTVAIGGMAFAAFASFVFNGLAREAPTVFYEVLPNCFAFFLVAINCRTRFRLQAIVVVFFFASVYIMSQGMAALRIEDIHSPWLYDQGYEGNHIMRLRGLGVVNDPNDLAQVFVSLLPCTFLLGKPKKLVWNLFFVGIPCAVLLYGVFLTHSRGSLVALMAVIGLVIYRKVGIIPAAVTAGGIFALSSVIGWSGGRDISVEAGSDRTDAWATGLELIRSHPIFGVGYRRFTEFNNITAHNTVVVCAAELGFLGFFFWVLFVVASLRQGITLRSITSKRRTDEAEPRHNVFSPATLHLQTAGPHPAPLQRTSTSLPEPYRALYGSYYASPERSEDSIESSVPGQADAPFGMAAVEPKLESEENIRAMAWIMVVALTGFLTAGWFLSRAYVMWLFMYGGMVQAIYSMAVARGIAPPPPSLPRLLRIAFVVSVALLLVVYVFLRVKKFFPGGD